MGDYFTDVFLKELREKFSNASLKVRCEKLIEQNELQLIITKHNLEPFDFFFFHDHICRIGNFEEQATEMFENPELIEWYFENIGKMNNKVTPDLAIEFGLKTKRILKQ